MQRVVIPWYSSKELLIKKIDEMNKLYNGTNLKAKLFTKMVGEGSLKCEEFAIVISKEKSRCAKHISKNIVQRNYK